MEAGSQRESHTAPGSAEFGIPRDAEVSLRPPRKAFVLAYLSVVVSGLFGAAIGAGLVDAMCTGSCTLNVTLGALGGAGMGAGGVGVVAVLVLRAMHEWNTHKHELAGQEQTGDERDGQGGRAEEVEGRAGPETSGGHTPPTC